VTVRFMTGFENGRLPDYLTSSGTPALSNTVRNSGVYGLTLAGSGVTVSGFGYTAGAAADHVTTGFAIRIPALPASDAVMASVRIGLSSNVQLLASPDGSVHVARATSATTVSGGNLASSAPGVFAANAWTYVVLRIVPSDTVGQVTVTINGAQVANATGVDNVASDLSAIRSLTFRNLATGTTAYDDIVMADQTGTGITGIFAPVRIEGLRATSTVAGALTGSDGNTVDNHLLVGEVPVVTTDFVQSNVAGTRDVYGCTDRTHTGPIVAVQTVAVATNPDTAASARLAVRSGASEALSAAKGLSAATQTIYHIAPVDPATGTDWTTAGVNGANAVVEVA